jgi:quercetin dioxygenase-like cupin family protein
MVKTKQKPTEAVKLVDVLEYQEGSVVSRTIIDKKAGTITMFAFDKNQGLSEHKAPYDALIHALEGESEITISGKKHSVKAGETIILPAHEPHAVKATTRFKMLLTMIRA